MQKVERIKIAAHVAPRLRDARPRLVKVVNAQGDVVREIDVRDVAHAVLEREQIEFSSERMCVGAHGNPCPDRKVGSEASFSSWSIKRRNRAPWRCRKCCKVTCALQPCAVCKAPATRRSSESARLQGCLPYCRRHKGGLRRPTPLRACVVCRKPIERKRGTRSTRCSEHKQARRVELMPCFVCGNPATKKSSSHARHVGTRAFCAEHPRGKPKG